MIVTINYSGSTEPDETESDLVIAPEKYKSDSTTGHYSSHVCSLYLNWNFLIFEVIFNFFLWSLFYQGSFDESVDEAFTKKGPLRSFWSNENNVDVRKLFTFYGSYT